MVSPTPVMESCAKTQPYTIWVYLKKNKDTKIFFLQSVFKKIQRIIFGMKVFDRNLYFQPLNPFDVVSRAIKDTIQCTSMEALDTKKI